jgi:Holliday junction resolvase
MNGTDAERHLLSVCRSLQYKSMRSPGSGTGDWDMPDVIAGREGILFVSELKAGDPPSNVQDTEVQALRRFGNAFGAAILLAARWKGDRTFYFAPPELCERTPSGHYSIPSSPDDWPWRFAIPYQESTDDALTWEADTGVGQNGILYSDSVDQTPPTLRDFMDAVTAAQQGFDVRNGIIDLGTPDRRVDPSDVGLPDLDSSSDDYSSDTDQTGD